MNVVPFQQLICPLDAEPLTLIDRSWRCCHGHSFDVARQGYTHLLPVQKKRSKDPGDHKDMVACRQRFLNAGHYQAIADAVNATVADHTTTDGTVACLDAGCGEGYYLRQLASSGVLSDLSLAGNDISKWAVMSAAKQHSDTTWLVASNASLPIANASLDWVLCLFGFPVMPEFYRVLKAGGRLMMVDPGPNHLVELKQVIYDSVKPARDNTVACLDGFALIDQKAVNTPVEVNDSATLLDLLAMTPHFYRASADARERLLAKERIEVSLDVQLRVYQKR